MKRTMFLLGGLVISLATTAQVKTPQLSPQAKVEQTVGLTKLEVEYSRPSLRNRDMHKEIIPFGQPWRFGANKNSVLTFNTPINFGGVDVKPGTYSMYAVPAEKEWKITLYDLKEGWGLPEKWEDSKVIAEVSVPVKKTKNTVETFTISFDNLNVNHFDLNIAWENTLLPVHIKLPTKELTTASIDKIMKGKPSERDYYSASSYYLNENIELEKSLEYVNKAIDINGNAPMYYIRNKALIYGAMGKKKEAIETAKISLEMARKSGSEEYIRKNEASIKEWSK